MMQASAENVLGHLLFHKSIIDEGDRAEKIDRYLRLLDEAGRMEEAGAADPLDRSLLNVFELVLAEDFDPWDINLMEFSKLYAGRMCSDEFSFIVAGKLVRMAWSILRMQSREVLELNEEPCVDLITEGWDMDSLGNMHEMEFDIDTSLPLSVNLTHAVRHPCQRPVSLVELLDAFEEAQEEIELHQEREKARLAAVAKIEKFDNKAHTEDLEKDVEETWKRILRCGPGPLVIDDLFGDDREDRVMVFVALLFLAKSGKIALWQDELPYGRICLEMKLPWEIGMVKEEKGIAVEQKVMVV
jgi:segregation and condensation protein A